MAKKKIAKPQKPRKTAKARKPVLPVKRQIGASSGRPAVAAPKRPRGRPPKAKPGATRPDTPPAPPAPLPPTDNQEIKLLAALLVRLASPLKALPVQTSEAVVYIRPEDIAYISTTKDRRILIVDRDGREWQRFDVLKKLFDRLSPDPRFFLAHKSCIVNLFAVKTLRKNPETKLNELTFGEKVKGTAPVSGGNLKELRARLEL